MFKNYRKSPHGENFQVSHSPQSQWDQDIRKYPLGKCPSSSWLRDERKITWVNSPLVPSALSGSDLTEHVFSPQPCAQQVPTASMEALAVGGRLSYDSQCQPINYNVDINTRGLVLPGVCFGHHPLLSLALAWFQRAWEQSPGPRGKHLCLKSNLISQIFTCSEKIMATAAWVSSISLHVSDFL